MSIRSKNHGQIDEGKCESVIETRLGTEIELHIVPAGFAWRPHLHRTRQHGICRRKACA